MSDSPKLREILADIQVTVGRTDERLQVVIDEQTDQKADLETLKTQRSWIVGAYVALTATFSAYLGFKE